MKRFLSKLTMVAVLAVAAVAAVAAGCGGGGGSTTPAPGGPTGAASSSPAASGTRAQGTGTSSQPASPTNAPPSDPLQALKQSNSLCLQVGGLRFQVGVVTAGGFQPGVDAQGRSVFQGIGFGSKKAPLTWDGANFSASIADYNGAGTRLTYSGTIAADGRSIKSLAATDLNSPGTQDSAHLELANIPYSPLASPEQASVQVYGWTAKVQGAAAAPLLASGAMSKGNPVSFDTTGSGGSISVTIGTAAQVGMICGG